MDLVNPKKEDFSLLTRLELELEYLKNGLTKNL